MKTWTLSNNDIKNTVYVDNMPAATVATSDAE